MKFNKTATRRKAKLIHNIIFTPEAVHPETWEQEFADYIASDLEIYIILPNSWSDVKIITFITTQWAQNQENGQNSKIVILLWYLINFFLQSNKVLYETGNSYINFY